MQDVVSWIEGTLAKLQNRTSDILRIRSKPELYRWILWLLFSVQFSNYVVASTDTWEWELSHVLEIYTDDFIHRAIVTLTSWQDIPEQAKKKAFEMLVAFVSNQIARMGPHSIRSSTYGLNHDNLNLNYRACQRAGRSIFFVHNILIHATISAHGQLEKSAFVSSAASWRRTDGSPNGWRLNLMHQWCRSIWSL